MLPMARLTPELSECRSLVKSCPELCNSELEGLASVAVLDSSTFSANIYWRSPISDTQLRAGHSTALSNPVKHFSLGACISHVTSSWSYSSCHNSPLCNRLSVHLRVLLPEDDSSKLIQSVVCLILSHLWEESVLSY